MGDYTRFQTLEKQSNSKNTQAGKLRARARAVGCLGDALFKDVERVRHLVCRHRQRRAQRDDVALWDMSNG